jgi:hypothetical protein
MEGNESESGRVEKFLFAYSPRSGGIEEIANSVDR